MILGIVYFMMKDVWDAELRVTWEDFVILESLAEILGVVYLTLH
jgi:hypothetical protein